MPRRSKPPEPRQRHSRAQVRAARQRAIARRARSWRDRHGAGAASAIEPKPQAPPARKAALEAFLEPYGREDLQFSSWRGARREFQLTAVQALPAGLARHAGIRELGLPAPGALSKRAPQRPWRCCCSACMPRHRNGYRARVKRSWLQLASEQIADGDASAARRPGPPIEPRLGSPGWWC